jgi:sulfite exporter TauE/SafE
LDSLTASAASAYHRFVDAWVDYVWKGLLVGSAQFAHCPGMCGGFALHLAGRDGQGPVLVRQLLWHAGKTVTYVFLGAIAGFAGGAIVAAGPQVVA